MTNRIRQHPEKMAFTPLIFITGYIIGFIIGAAVAIAIMMGIFL